MGNEISLTQNSRQYTKNLVSIVTPGWNGVAFVHRLLNSILSQTYKNIEYIYVDDGSTDGTREIILSYETKFQEAGMGFEYIFQENAGVSAALNTALKRVRGEFLCWPEYDDFLTPDSVQKKLDYLREHPACAVVTSDAWIINEKDLTKTTGLLSKKNPNRFERNQFIHLLLSNSIFVAGCHMARMKEFDDTHPARTIFPATIGPNWQMLLPLYYKYERGFIDEPLLYYLCRDSSISHNNQKSIKARLSAIASYLEILNSVLNDIPMPEDERNKYKTMVAVRYAATRLSMALRNSDLPLLREQYKILKQNKALTTKHKIIYLIANNQALSMLYKFSHMLRNTLKVLKNKFRRFSNH
ncbi:MAG: glycosyltransferase [Elusimicrobiaceae bacterium]